MLGELLFFLIGLSLGSFGNVVMHRLKTGQSLQGRSKCPHCHRTLAAVDLIPLLSYVVLQGKCRNCGATIGWQYPLVELVSGGLFLLAYTAFPLDAFHALAFGFALWLLLLIAVFDYLSHTIPDAFSIPLIFIGFILAAMTGAFPLTAALIGAGFFTLQWVLSRGKWVGSGDIFLGAGIGAVLGTPFLTISALFLSYAIGALTASFLLLTNKVNRKSKIAFGPFLVLGTGLTLLLKERLEILEMLWL